MAQITITIPNEHAERVQNAFASRVGKDNEPENVTLDDVKGELVNIVRLVVRQHEEAAAAKAAQAGIEDVAPT